MRVGQMKTPFSLQRENGAGVWQEVASLWGWLAPATEGILSEAARRITHSIVVRYAPEVGIQSGMRLVFGTRSFLIRQVANAAEEGVWLRLFVTEEQGLD